MIKGILFDKDGTLLDFNRTWLSPYRQAASYLADSLGQPELEIELMEKGGFITETETWVPDSLLASGSNQQILEFWAEQLGQPLEGEKLKAIRDIFAHAASSYVPVLDDLRGFLQCFRDQSIKLGVATMDDEANAYGMLHKLDLTHLFDFVCGADSGFGVKPEPGMVLAFCDHCKVEPSEILMVGDSPKDLNMGKNAGVACSVGVLTGAHSETELRPYADTVFKNIEGINDLLG